MGRCWNVSFTHDRSGKAREHPLHRKEFQGSLWSTRNDGSIARSLPSFARMVQGNANFSTLTVFFLFFWWNYWWRNFIINPWVCRIYVLSFFFLFRYYNYNKNFFSDTVQIFESILLDYWRFINCWMVHDFFDVV